MPHRSPISPFATGAAVIAAMLVIVGVIVINGIPGGPNVGFPWDHSFTVKAQMPEADALAPKASVEIAGVKVGEVHSVELQGNTAVATLNIYPRYSDIHSDARVLLRPHGLFGPKYIELEPGTSAAPLLHDGDSISGNQAVIAVDLDQILQELQAPEQQQLKTAIVELGKAAAGRGTDFNQLVQAGNTLSQVLDQPLHSLDAYTTNLSDMFVKDEAFNASFAQTPLDKLVEASNVSLRAFAETSGQLGDLLDHADRALTNLDASLSGESGNIRTFLDKAPGIIDQLTTFNNLLARFTGALNGNDTDVISSSILLDPPSNDPTFNRGLAAAIENPWSALSSYDGTCKPNTYDTSHNAWCSPDGHFHYFRVQTFTGANRPTTSSLLLPNPQSGSLAGLFNGDGFSANDLATFGALIGS